MMVETLFFFLSGQYSDFRTPDSPFPLAGFGATGPDVYRHEANATTGQPCMSVPYYYFLVHVYFSTVRLLLSAAVRVFSW